LKDYTSNMGQVRPRVSSPILVVEDDADARTALIDILEISGFAAVPASNGREALEYLRRSSKPSCIILDLLMPEMDGWEFRIEQKNDPKIAMVPVIVVTAFGGATIDADEILVKPIDVDHLLRIVGNYAVSE
jgi:CheY-like chemotaxis protein